MNAPPSGWPLLLAGDGESAYTFSETVAMKRAGHPLWLPAMRAAIRAGAWCAPVWRRPK